VKASEAKELEIELQLLRLENSDLKKRISELSSVDAAKKKAEERVEVLESKVRPSSFTPIVFRLGLCPRWKT
jgi:homeobox protein cut-like